MSTSFISLPQDVLIPPAWLETPQQKDQVDQVAQSFFSEWKNDEVSKASFRLKVGSVTVLASLGVSIFMLSIPGILLCGAGLTICLIGIKAIHREQMARYRKACLQLEEWLISFKNGCEGLKYVLAPLLHVNNLTTDLDQHPRFAGVMQDLSSALKGIPGENVEDLAKSLEEHHHLIFGEWRKIGKGYWSPYWIRHHLSLVFGGKLSYFYAGLEGLKETLQKCEKDPTYDKKMILLGAELILDNIEPKNKSPTSKVATIDQTKMYLLTDRFDAPMQGKEDFASLMDETEYWRQNIAAFRSSL
jgi:hypothetical protein